MPGIKLGFTAKQIIEESRTTEQYIEHIRTWLATQHKLPNLTDEQIVLFLLSCENALEPTMATISVFYSIRGRTPEIFNNRKLERQDLQQNLDLAYLCVLPKRTDDRCAILVSRLRDTNYRNAEMHAYLTNFCMAIEMALYDHPPTGLIVLCDMQGMGLMHFTRVKLGLLRVFLRYLQEGLPVKLKSIHMLNCYSLLNKLVAMIKPFVKKEVMEKLKFHPTDESMESFYRDWVPKRCLPEDYGGDLPSIEVLHERHIQKMVSLQVYFDEEEEQRCNINKFI